MCVYLNRLTINDLFRKKWLKYMLNKQHRLPNKEFGHAHLAQIKVTNVAIRLYRCMMLLYFIKMWNW